MTANLPDLIVVFDSGVWISGLQFGGVPLAALKMTYLRHHIACCAQIKFEIDKVMRRKFRWTSDQVHDALNVFLETSSDIAVPGLLTNACRDPNDNMVLECAVLAKANVIVSSDNDLRTLNPYLDIQIVNPRDYCTGILGLTVDQIQTMGAVWI
jgi:putative PIN family toxin of toxin-antitoxin system